MITFNFHLRNFTLRFFLFILTLFQFSLNNCKLTLNNPSDPKSKSYFETALWNAYLNTRCIPDARGSFSLGTGNTLVTPLSIKALKSGNTVVTAVTQEPLVWNGNTSGIHNNHQNSVLNGVVFVIDRYFSRILWLDYIGEMSYGVEDWPTPEVISVDEFSNGDLGFFAIVNGTGRTNTLNAKTGTLAFFLSRYNQYSGEIVWQGYANKDNTRFTNKGYAMTVTPFDQMAILYQGISETTTPTIDFTGLSFPNLPAPSTSSNASSPSQKELGLALVDGNGYGISQRFLPNTGSSSEPKFFKSYADKLLIAGESSNEFISFSGHPRLSEPRGFYGIVNSTLSWDSVGYYGPTISATGYKIIKSLFANNEVYLIGNINEPDSTPNTIHQYQGSSGRRNYQILKPDRSSTSLLWSQYLGATSYNVPDVIPGNLIYNSTRGEVVGNLLMIDNGTPFTGISSNIQSGSVVNAVGQARLKMNPSTGAFQQIQLYEGTSDATGNNGRFISNQAEVCSGRMVTIHTMFNSFSTLTTARRIEVSTRPGSEEP
ncbi:hypothetical protein EHQ68_17070 [Leptospira congkakensis]|uniref:Uncharacterized protein n=1 Tax=Leptospira congkakensis TaxID=2484932 RepID=A0A4Z1A8Z2_9LEPT|nr:hypothetical protein [Leptospira congkakensis]TGL85521.1 hypothetical protein EHQ68_17070 [Leptospira congkakensis]TGL92280.1 hypothetical protein EHQ69_08360 [Leptospira congkakensis]TGM00026.1 hypothetical protein EHQ70_00315 [Leptospira congkakensis]